MHKTLRSAKKEGLLNYSNRKLANSIEKLRDIGFLIPQSASKFTIAHDYIEKKEVYLERVLKSKNE